MLASTLFCVWAIIGSEEKGIEETLKAESFLFGEEGVVVSASKHEEPLSRSPSAITVISGDDLKRYGSLIDALRTVPGLDVVGLSPSYTVIDIRQNAKSLNSNVLFLIDGRKTTIDLFGFSIIEILPISLDDIERIEIIRGPGSALYGSALNGLINIITKDPKKTEGFLFRAAAGNFSTRQFAARASGKKGDALRYRITASYDTTDSREASYVSKRSQRAMSRLLYDFSPASTLEFQSAIDRTYAGNPEGFVVPNGYDFLTYFAYLGWDQKKTDQEIHAQAYSTRIEGKMILPVWEMIKNIIGVGVGPTFSSLDLMNIPVSGNIYDGEAYYTPFTDLYHNRLTLGAQLRYMDARTPFAEQKILKEEIAALYLQDEFSPLESMTLLLGGRYDYNSVSLPSFSPRASLVYSPGGGHTLRASYGKSFRKPSFVENQFRVAGLSDRSVLGVVMAWSNPDLKNQESVSYELGYQWRHRSIRVFLDTFLTTTKNRILQDVQNYVIQFRNDPRSYTYYGGEIGAEWAVVRDIFRISPSYSLLKGDGLEGLEPPQSGTRKKFSATAHLKIPGGPGKFDLSSQGSYIDERTSPISEPTLAGTILPSKIVKLSPYFLLNVNASYTLADPKVEFGVSVFNILNEAVLDYPREYTSASGYYGGEKLKRTVLGYVRAEF